MRYVTHALAITLALSATAAHAVVSYSTPGGTYSQNFDTLDAAGTTSDLTWTNDSTLPGWSLFISTGAAPATYRSDDGGSNVGNFFSYGADTVAERALGALASGGAYFGSPASGAVAGHVAVQITNNTGSTLVSFTANYDGEQWRDQNTTAQTMTVEYGFGATFGAVGTWTSAGAAFDFTTPINANGLQLNGNLAANRVAGLGGTIGSLNWLDSTSLWIRFVDVNQTGNDHAMAIDNFSFSADAAPGPIPTPAALPAALVMIGLMATRRRR